VMDVARVVKEDDEGIEEPTGDDEGGAA
jgi:hypothetical protein